MRLAAVLMLAATAASGQSRITGIAFDSIANAPLARAYVAIPTLHRSTTADSAGRFVFDSIAPGVYVIHVQHDALDALGMAEIASRIELGTNAPIVVGVPSFATLWRERCSGTPPSDSALVFGTVTAPGSRPAANASVAVAWLDLVVQNKTTVSQHQKVGRVSADGAGHYVLCGVPMSTGLTLRASLGASESGPIEVLPLQASVLRRDIQLNAANAVMFGTVTGTVTMEGREPTGARVAIEGAGEVRVGGDAKFTIRNVPVGTHAIEATFIGMSPALAAVDVRPGATTTVDLELKKVVELDAVKVTGSAVRMQLAREFEQRRAEGLGKYADSTQIAKYPSLESFFQSVPFAFVKGATARRAIYIGNCRQPATLIVDGIVTAPGDFAWRDQRDIAAVETYDHLVPMEFQAKVGKPCSLVVIWTKGRFP